MNVRDSEHIIAELGEKENYVLTDILAEAWFDFGQWKVLGKSPSVSFFSEGENTIYKKRRR